ncbi:hypothetical protein ACVWZ4_002055 [Bradyrhizobium sp. USDA 4472]
MVWQKFSNDSNLRSTVHGVVFDILSNVTRP